VQHLGENKQPDKLQHEAIRSAELYFKIKEHLIPYLEKIRDVRLFV